MSTEFTFQETDETKIRIDQYIQKNLPEFSRSQIQKLIKDENILVNNKAVAKNYTLQAGDKIVFNKTELKSIANTAIEMPLSIIYEDSNVLVLNKPAGISVHPRDEKDLTPTRVNGILAHCGKELTGIGDKLRPGIVHRLDKDTSGVLIVAKNQKTHRFLSEQFENRTVDKEYLSLIYKELNPPQGQIDSPIGRNPSMRQQMTISNLANARHAITNYQVANILKDQAGRYSYCRIKILTGRTHQIRVHFQAIGHPVIGDTTYGNSKINQHFAKEYQLDRQFLHAHSLGLILPNQTEKTVFKAPLDSMLQTVLDKLAD